MARQVAAPAEWPGRDVVVTCTLNWPFPLRNAWWLALIGTDPSGNRYRYFEDATAGEWRAAERGARQGAIGPDQKHAAQLSQIVKLADALHIADDIVLWPRLAALAKAGTTTVTVK